MLYLVKMKVSKNMFIRSQSGNGESTSIAGTAKVDGLAAEVLAMFFNNISWRI